MEINNMIQYLKKKKKNREFKDSGIGSWGIFD